MLPRHLTKWDEPTLKPGQTFQEALEEQIAIKISEVTFEILNADDDMAPNSMPTTSPINWHEIEHKASLRLQKANGGTPPGYIDYIKRVNKIRAAIHRATARRSQ